MNNKKILSALRFPAAGILCLAAAYLTEKSLGELASIPFIILLPAIAYILYRKPFHIIGLCSLGALVFNALFNASSAEILSAVLVCAFIPGLTVAALFPLLNKKRRSKKAYIISFALFVAVFSIFTALFGTFPGNASSKALNEKYISQTYPDEDFTVGSTYYSPKDRRYLTEAVFRDKEVYKALFSANKDGSAEIDGYRDYCEARLLEYGYDTLLSYLSSHVHEGEDFALRRDSIDTAELLFAGDSPEEYYSLMSYDIAFYSAFSSPDDFEAMCREYVGYIPESFLYRSIRFYGLGTGSDFEYQLTYTPGSAIFSSEPFNKDEFSEYFTDKDTHKYWSVIK